MRSRVCYTATVVALAVQVALCYDGQPAPSTAPVMCDGQDLATCSADKARMAYTADDFVFDFNSTSVDNAGGSVRGEFVNNNPALALLNEHGVGQTLITLKPCAINQPSVHPRGTEVSFVIKGTVFIGFVEENPSKDAAWGGRFIGKNVTAGQSFVIPQGLMHFQQNLECEEAQVLATFTTRDPGTVTLLRAMFQNDIPDDVLRATTGLAVDTIQAIRSQVQGMPNPSVDKDCMDRCGLDMPQEMGKDEYSQLFEAAGR